MGSRDLLALSSLSTRYTCRSRICDCTTTARKERRREIESVYLEAPVRKLSEGSRGASGHASGFSLKPTHDPPLSMCRQVTGSLHG
jgi:hypothetical protein